MQMQMQCKIAMLVAPLGRLQVIRAAATVELPRGIPWKLEKKSKATFANFPPSPLANAN